MTWFVVGGVAIGATAGAIVGSKKGGDDVWKDALIGGAIGGTAGAGAGFGAGAFGAAEAAAPAVAAGEGGAGILGAGEIAGGIAAPELVGMGGAAMTETPAGLAAFAPAAEGAAAPAASGGFGSAFSGTPSFGGSGASFGSFGGASAPEGGGLLNAGFAPGMQAPVEMVSAPAPATTSGEFGSSFGDVSGAKLAGSEAPFGSVGNANVAQSSGSSVFNDVPKQSMFDKALGWVEENPFKAGILGFTALGLSGALNRDNNQTFGGSNVQTAGYPLSPNFKPSRYEPTRTYADGGIAFAGRQANMFPQSQMDRTQFSTPTQMPISREIIDSDYDATINPYTGDLPRFAKGGKTSAEQFAAMTDIAAAPQETPPSYVRRELVDPMDSGLFVDTDVETRDQPAMTAAQTRMAKLASKYGIAPRKLTAEESQKNMAGGGIADLGGYAHGGNPRLLRGPGDGMSDDIPATIADKQPARLADGEFVVPADVVSGLGNGSTEAGAKKLHQMMDKVRVDRTGSKKQGKKINADKYVSGMASGGIASYASGNLVVQDGQVGTYNDEGGFEPLNSSILNATQQQVSPTANTTAQGYNPDYYNLGYYQSKLPSLQEQLNAFAGQKSFDPAYYLKANPDVAAAGVDPWQHYQQFGIKEGRSPYEGGQAGAQLLDLSAQQSVQNQLQDVQNNIARLEGSSIKYDPYTVANRPSAAEPQFYGNIYRGQSPDYSTPGYTLTGGNLGEWSNVAGEAARAAQPASLNQQITQAYLQDLGRAPDTSGFNYWMQGDASAPAKVNAIQQSAEAQNIKQTEKPKEEKKRKGGILAINK